MNLGLEVSPYWLQSHPTLTRDKYLHPNLLHTFLQSFSISAATVKDSASGANNLGVGFRFKVINGKPVPQQDTADRILKRSDKIVGLINTAAFFQQQDHLLFPTIDSAIKFVKSKMVQVEYAQDTLDNIVNKGKSIAGNFKNNPDSIVAFLDTFRNIIDTGINGLGQRTATITQQRKGFILEFAGASAFNTSRNNELNRIGVWGNLSNYLTQSDLFTLTLRYMYHNSDTLVSNFDAGLSYMKKKDKYNFYIEYMLRWYSAQFPGINSSGQTTTIKQNDFSYRLAFQSSFMLTSQISLNLSLGKDFNTPFITNNGFFSILGFNYRIFNNDKVAPNSR